jgi:hypothetical protein
LLTAREEKKRFGKEEHSLQTDSELSDGCLLCRLAAQAEHGQTDSVRFPEISVIENA